MFFNKKQARYGVTIGITLVAGFAILEQMADGQPVQQENPVMADSASKAADISPLAKTDPLPAKKPGNASDHATIGRDDNDYPFTEREVKARLAQVADNYAEQIQYPAFSRPILDKEALQKYLPNKGFDSSVPLDPNNVNSPQLSLKTSQQQYFAGDKVIATVNVSGLADYPDVSISGRLVEGGRPLAAMTSKSVDASGTQYQLSLTTGDNAFETTTDQLRVIASVTIDGIKHEIGAPITYVHSVAQLTDVGFSEVYGEYLTIPVSVTTNTPGYHEIGANLYAADSNEPLVHLTAEQELMSENGVMQLQAHISALKVKGHSGPYRLKDIILTRMPAPPNFTTEYGRTSQSSYEVNGFAFDDYVDAPYVDEEAEKRLEFLRTIGSVE
jgi:hypothetical protein